jgi:predicted lipid-binding transport protein (Tim44 family)
MEQYADIIIFAVIAFILFLRLFMVLGQKKGRAGEDITIIKFKSPHDAQNNPENLEVEVNGSNSLEAKIKIFNPNFSQESFIKQSEEQFKKILAAYCGGDNVELSKMVNIEILRKFAYSIAVIEERKCTHNLQLIKNEDSSIENIDIVGNMAIIKIRFIAEIIHSISNAKGKLIAGHESKIEKINQVWTFSKELKFEETPWIVTDIPDGLIYTIK